MQVDKIIHTVAQNAPEDVHVCAPLSSQAACPGSTHPG